MDNKFDYFEEKTEKEQQKDNDREEAVDTESGEFNSFSEDGFSDYNEDSIAPYGAYNETRYNELFDKSGKKTMAFSVTSMVLGILSLVCCSIGFFGLILAVLAVIFSVISRRSLGYFDGMSVAGLILGIFGICFGVVVAVITVMVASGNFEDLGNDMVYLLLKK